MDHQDAFWVERAQRGDTTAFGLLVEKYGAQVLRLLQRTTGSANDAHDLAQETWLHAYVGLHRLRDKQRFGGWVLAIARNIARMWLRQADRTPGEQAMLDDLLDDTALEDDALARELRTSVQQAVDQLGQLNREVIQLHYLEGRSYSEIAAKLDISTQTVKSRLYKARQQLKPRLQSLRDVPTPTIAQQEDFAMHTALIHDVYVVEHAERPVAQYVMVLKVQHQERYLPIWIGQPEAEGIAAPLRSLTPRRPLTHDLTSQLLEHLNGRVEAVELDRLENEVFYARLRINVSNGQFTLDCRPSDALALAIRTNAPIQIADELLGAEGRDQPQAISKPGDEAQIVSVLPLELERFGDMSKNIYAPQS